MTKALRERVMAGLARVRAEGDKRLGRPKIGDKKEAAIRARLAAGEAMLKVARAPGVGGSTVRHARWADNATRLRAIWPASHLDTSRRHLPARR